MGKPRSRFRGISSDVNLMVKRAAAACVLMLSAVLPAAAQERPFSFMAAGAVTAPLSNSADRFRMGLGFTGRAAWEFADQLS